MFEAELRICEECEAALLILNGQPDPRARQSYTLRCDWSDWAVRKTFTPHDPSCSQWTGSDPDEGAS